MCAGLAEARRLATVSGIAIPRALKTKSGGRAASWFTANASPTITAIPSRKSLT